MNHLFNNMHNTTLYITESPNCVASVMLDVEIDPAIRVWQSPHPATGDTPLLVAGQTVTNSTSILTYTFVGTGEAEGIISRASLKITAAKVDFVNATSSKSGASLNPPPFEGGKPWPFNVTRSLNPDKHMVVFYKDVIDSAFDVKDFDVALTASYSPESALREGDLGYWEKIEGPDSGFKDPQCYPEVAYHNPKVGGVYRFRFRSSLIGDGSISEANVVLPLAGAEMDSVMKSDLLLADAFVAKAMAKYTFDELHDPKNWLNWFWNNHAGDYTGRPDNAITPTVWAYNQVNDTSGFGAVCTWKGRPIRLTKLSNFILGYAMQQIGVSRDVARQSTRIFGITETTDKASVGAGWDVANGANYDTTVTNLVNYIWTHEEDDDKSRKLWPNPNVPDNNKGSSTTELFNYNTGYGAPGFLFMEP